MPRGASFNLQRALARRARCYICCMEESFSRPLNSTCRASTAKSIRDAADERTRAAYLEKPDVEFSDDDWPDAEEWVP